MTDQPQLALTPLSIFYSYAHGDEALRDELEKHLSLLQRQGFITGWHDRKIVPGTNWAQAIDSHLNEASIILLLISPNFLASDYCYGIEMERALERHAIQEAHVVPILLRPVDWEGAPFAHLQVLPTNTRAITTWKNKDKAFANVAAGIRRTIESLAPHPIKIPSSITSSVWTVPYRRNPFFTGREQVLAYLHEKLASSNSVALTQPRAISGLGGIGKTQTAIEYAYRYRDQYRTVFWVKADTSETLISDYVAIAHLLNLPEKNAQDQHLIVNSVKNWLEASSGWLLILDNADDLSIIQDFLPTAAKGHILLTTRARPTGKLAQRVELDKMGIEEGILLLLRRVGIITPDASLESVPADRAQQAHELVTLLDGLPLALDQAGAYIEETDTDLSRYLELYKTHRVWLLRRRSNLPTDHPEPVASTWSLSFQKIERLKPIAADLLRFCAFLQPDAIPEEIIIKGASDLGTQFGSTASDPLQLDEAIGELLRFSLIRRHYESKTLTIHRLVQTVLKDEMDASTQQLWAERTVRAINLGFSDLRITSWTICQLYFPHALVCAALIDHWNITLPEAAHLLHQAGAYARIRSQYQEAEMLLRRAVMLREQVLGPGHVDTAKSREVLASLYLSQGKDEQARSLIEQAIEAYEQSLGTEHSRLTGSLWILAALHKRQSDYERAEILLKRALAIAEQAYGPNDSYIADFLAELAELYTSQKQYEQAESFIKRALELLDSEPETDESGARVANEFAANVLERLARCYFHQDRYEQAEQLFQRTLAIMEQVQELDPTTAESLKFLADIYMTRDKYEQAEQLYQRSLTIWEQIMGTEHYLTENSRYGLIQSYLNQGKYEQALTEYTHIITRNPHSVLAYLRRGYIYLHLKEREFARRDLARYAALQPDDMNGAWMTVYAALGMQKPGVETVERLETIVLLDPASDEACVCRGVALELRGNLQEGLAELERALSLSAENEDAWFWKGMICACLGHNAMAIESIEQALKAGLPPILLTPLCWLKQDSPDFYQEYAEPLLKRFEVL